MEEKLDDEFVQGDYDAVLSIVREDILEQQQCISMETLQTAYGIGVGSCQSQHKLKFRLQKTFLDRLIFLSQDYHSLAVVISKECLWRQTWH